MKRIWAIGLLSVSVTFIVAACGGGSSLSPTSTPIDEPTPLGESTPVVVDEPTPAAESTPVAVDDPTPTPESTPVVVDEPTPAQESTATATPEPKYTWEVIAVDDPGSKPSVAVDSQGTPHIAYILEDMPGWVKHAVLDGDNWNISTLSTGYFYGPLDIVVDDTGVPHVSWHNHDEENEAYATIVNGTWEVYDVDDPGHDGWDNDLAIDSSHLPHTASIDPVQFGSQSGVEYATFDGESWTVEEIGSGPVPYEFGTGIALDSQDRPHVVWFDDASADLKYAIKTEGTWTISEVDTQGDVGRYPSLVLDRQGNPAVSYFQWDGGREGSIKYARWDGGEWDIQRVGELGNVVIGHFGARKINSLVLDENDNPIIAFSDEDVIKLAWWDGSEWHVEIVLDAGDMTLGQQVSLALDGQGILHMTYADVVSKRLPGVNGTIYYARGTPSFE